ncbi:hypothetical protein ACFWBN_35130 [Streptomyces sp. NPDC059989]|uniref:WXG100-like domain-containing protein n=1 Tax=Streptomyces sp. NPDC059989 TaxID=3347026 RepID=UPI0036CEFE56
MAIEKPLGADTLLDLLGATWPEVNEDLYLEASDALRAFAERMADDGHLANTNIRRLLSTGSGQSFDALNAHWNAILARPFADLLTAADIIARAMADTGFRVGETKLAIRNVLIELGVEISAANATSALTFGQSPAVAASMAVARTSIAKHIRHCVQGTTHTLATAEADPAVTAVALMTAERLRKTGAEGGVAGGAVGGFAPAGAAGGSNGLAVGGGAGGATGGAAGAATGGAAGGAAGGGATGGSVGGATGGLAAGGAVGGAAGGGGIGGGSGGWLGSGLADLEVEHAEHDRARNRLGDVGTRIHGKTSAKLAEAAAHHAGTRGRGVIAQAVDPHADRLLGALKTATGHLGDHIGTTLSKAAKQISTDHRTTDHAVHASLTRRRLSGN